MFDYVTAGYCTLVSLYLGIVAFSFKLDKVEHVL